MVSYILLGYGVTDSNGKAKLSYDSSGNPIEHSYTGTGAGEIDIVASLDDTITESSTISNDYVILDGTFLDRAVEGQKNTNWSNPSNYVSVTTLDDGTLLSSTSGTRHYWANNYTQFTDPFAIELDILSYDAINFRFQFYTFDIQVCML